MAASTVARVAIAADHYDANPCSGDFGSVRQTAAPLVDRTVWEEHPGARNVVGIFPTGGNGAGHVGADGYLLGSAAEREALETRVAGSHSGNPTVVAYECAIWFLCAEDAGQRGVWRLSGRDWLVGLDADIRCDCVFGCGVERRGSGHQEQ